MTNSSIKKFFVVFVILILHPLDLLPEHHITHNMTNLINLSDAVKFIKKKRKAEEKTKEKFEEKRNEK